MKACFKCLSVKPLSGFYVHSGTMDGHLGKCIECTKLDVKARYYAKHGDIMRYERDRAQRIERRTSQAESVVRHRARHPERARARNMVAAAVRDGRLVRWPCEVCGRTAQAHHEDYSRPLDVRWLCFRHHREIAHHQITETA